MAGPEIERRFLLAAAPPDTAGPGRRLRQGYLAVTADVEVRVRDDEGRCSLTVKGGRGLVRSEVDVPVDAERFDALWPLTAGRRVVKTRRVVPLGELDAEVDEYDEDLAGLQTVEVEFPDEDAAGRFEPPPWFGEELTGRPGWSNAALAVHGRPSTPGG